MIVPRGWIRNNPGENEPVARVVLRVRSTDDQKETAMTNVSRIVIAVLYVIALIGPAAAGSPEADPDALQILNRMTDYLGGLENFSMHTENSYEDVFDSGQKIQHDFSSSIVISRPDKLFAERTDGEIDQFFTHDGALLSMYESGHDIYATVTAPDNIDDMLAFARDTLDLVPPAGDMVFTNAYELLTASVTSGSVVGKAIIGGVAPRRMCQYGRGLPVRQRLLQAVPAGHHGRLRPGGGTVRIPAGIDTK
jgi:hypothetical protein